VQNNGQFIPQASNDFLAALRWQVAVEVRIKAVGEYELQASH
jgi:hypothetical protein